MKTNHWTIKLLLSGAMAALVLTAGTAFAGEAKYERHGRFVKYVVSHESAAASSQVAYSNAGATYDKGSLGAYERHGRFVKRSDIGGGGRTRKAVAEPARAGVRHEHGVNAKGHRNVSN